MLESHVECDWSQRPTMQKHRLFCGNTFFLAHTCLVQIHKNKIEPSLLNLTICLLFMYLLSTIYILFLSQVSHPSNNIAPFGFLFLPLCTQLFLSILPVIEKDSVGRRDDSQVMFSWGSRVHYKSGKLGRVQQRFWCLIHGCIPLILLFFFLRRTERVLTEVW